MSVFTDAMIRGMSDRMLDAGLISWPSQKVADEVCSKLAAHLQGPEILPEEGLSKESAHRIMVELKIAADRLSQRGLRADGAAAAQFKAAASQTLEERAARVAVACMDKAADEHSDPHAGSLTDVGHNTPESAAEHDQHAAKDQENRPQGQYNFGVRGVGRTQMPQGGVVGKEMAPTVAPGNSPSINNSITRQSKVASMVDYALGITDKLSNEDMPMADLGGAGGGMGGPGGAGGGMGGPGGGQGGEGGEEIPPELLQKLMMMLAAMKGQGASPSPEAGMAMGGMAQHPQGMDVMAHVLSTSKTASEINQKLAGIWEDMRRGGNIPSEGVVRAVKVAMDESAKCKDCGKKHEGDCSKEASADERLLAILKQGAEGSLTDVKPNTAGDAAKHDQHAALDLKNRPAEKYDHGVRGVGKSEMQPGKALEEIVKAPVKTHKDVKTDTVPSRETKSAEEALSGEDREYVEAFKKVAASYGSKLPVAMPQEEKVALLRTLMALPPSARDSHVAQAVQG